MSKRSLWLAWTLVTGLVWAVAPLDLLNTRIQSLPEIMPMLVVYVLFGGGLGMVLGTLQGAVLRLARHPVKGWWLDSLTGFALAFPAGLLVSTLIPLISWGLKGEPFLAAESGLTYSPYPASVITCGFLVGLVQWRTLRQLFPKSSRVQAALWVAGAWLSVGLGAFFPRGGLTPPLLVIVASLLAGAASAGVLVILFVKKSALPARPKSMAFVHPKRRRRGRSET